VASELTLFEIHKHQGEVHELNKSKGWYDEPVPFIQAMGLLVTEIDEACEAYHENGISPEFKSELADVYIRLLDDGSRYHVDMSTATDVYRFGKLTPGSCIESDLWLIIKPVVKAIEAYRVHGLDYEDKAGSAIASAFAEIYHALEFVCRGYGVELAKAFDIKMAKNWTRPYRHGGKHA
jgi:NTP pyrophosphatase (non-canonical NTP hydrolase)